MKIPALLLGCCLLASNLYATAPYPSVLTVKYKDQMLPVVHVHGTDPVVLVDGREKEIRSAPAYVIQGAGGFADNYVESSPGALGGPFRIRFLGGGGSPTAGLTYIEVPLTARKTIKQGFAVVVIYADISKTTDLQEKAFGIKPPTMSEPVTNELLAGNGNKAPHVSDRRARLSDPFLTGTSIIVHDLPELPAGKAIKVKFTSGAGVALLATDYFIQVFDDEGREVRTADVESAWQFYARRDRARLTVAIEKYLEKFKGTDHDAVPAIMPKPIFPPDAVMPAGQVVVTLTVESDGTVSEVEAADVKDDGVRQSLTNALGGWLFLPRLQAGVPIATKVSFPLKF